MAIENRDFEAGTKLIAKYKKEEHRTEVVAGEEGKVKYKLADGKEFKSPSSAGTAITTKAWNGWAFWSVEPEEEKPPEEAASKKTSQQLPSNLAYLKGRFLKGACLSPRSPGSLTAPPAEV